MSLNVTKIFDSIYTDLKGQSVEARYWTRNIIILLEGDKMKKCWNCGKPAEVISTKETGRCYCKKCDEFRKFILKKEDQEYVKLKKKRMLNSAIEKLEKQSLDMYRYKEAIDAVSEFLEEHPDKFDSSEEIMSAVILCHNRIKCIFQYKVLRYQCDICIPDWKVIVEIDGDRHASKRTSDNYRDIEIINELGDEWNIIRIKAELIDTKAENIIKAIKEVMKQRIKDGKAVR